MPHIDDLPPDYDFGLDFNYENWSENSTITLCNVPWNADYRDIVKFPNTDALNAYINGMANTSHTISDASYIKPNEPIYLPITFNNASKYNYLRVENPLQPVGAGDTKRWYYYFIVGVHYESPETTRVTLQLDVWSTYGNDVTFGTCFIEQGHIGVANENQMLNWGRGHLTVPEGLDLGSDYLIRDRFNVWGEAVNTGDFDVIITTTTSLTSTPRRKIPDTTPQEYAPVVQSAHGGSLQGVRTATSTYLLRGSEVADYFDDMGEFPWITQGIISVVVIPKITHFFPGYDYDERRVPNGPVDPKDGAPYYPPGPFEGRSYLHFLPRDASSGDRGPNGSRESTLYAFRDHMRSLIPQRYRHLSKLLTFPYSAIEVSHLNGGPMVIKPESVASNDLTLRSLLTIIPGNERIETYPYKYNAVSGVTAGQFDDGGEYLDQMIVLSDMPRLPVVNNQALLAVASQANSLASQRQSLDWSQQRALAGNQNTYDSTTTGINAARATAQQNRSAALQANDISNRTMATQNGLSALGGIATGAGMGAIGGPQAALAGAAGGAGSAILSAAATNIQMDANNQMAALNFETGAINDQRGFAAQERVRDSNKDLADWASKGDYAQAVGALNAKVQDLASTQPSMSAQFGGMFARLVHGGFPLTIRIKMVDQAALLRVGEYWLRYGYKVNQFGVPPADLRCMTKFTYWKLAETYLIAGPMPETFKQTIRGIFEKGVTVWSNPNDIGRINIGDNAPLGGIEL